MTDKLVALTCALIVTIGMSLSVKPFDALANAHSSFNVTMTFVEESKSCLDISAKNNTLHSETKMSRLFLTYVDISKSVIK